MEYESRTACIVVSWLVLWAQSTTVANIRANVPWILLYNYSQHKTSPPPPPPPPPQTNKRNQNNEKQTSVIILLITFKNTCWYCEFSWTWCFLCGELTALILGTVISLRLTLNLPSSQPWQTCHDKTQSYHDTVKSLIHCTCRTYHYVWRGSYMFEEDQRKMKLNGPGRQKLRRQNFWQRLQHTKRHSHLLQASLIALNAQNSEHRFWFLRPQYPILGLWLFVG